MSLQSDWRGEQRGGLGNLNGANGVNAHSVYFDDGNIDWPG